MGWRLAAAISSASSLGESCRATWGSGLPALAQPDSASSTLAVNKPAARTGRDRESDMSFTMTSDGSSAVSYQTMALNRRARQLRVFGTPREQAIRPTRFLRAISRRTRRDALLLGNRWRFAVETGRTPSDGVIT